jgi:hypothetical protein
MNHVNNIDTNAIADVIRRLTEWINRHLFKLMALTFGFTLYELLTVIECGDTSRNVILWFLMLMMLYSHMH